MQLQDVLADDLFEEHKQLYNIRSSRATFQATIFYQILKSNAKRLDIKYIVWFDNNYSESNSKSLCIQVYTNHKFTKYVLKLRSRTYQQHR